MAGSPNGQRTATRRNARGVRPSWRATTARSSITADARRRLARRPPLGDPFDDEQPLAGLHVAEAPGLAHQRRVARLRRQPPLEPRLLRLERAQLRLGTRDVAARLEVARQRSVVEERDEADDSDRQPATERESSPGTLRDSPHQDRFVAVPRG